MRLPERVDKIEMALVRHLEESGSIKTDLAWLKKAFWTLAGAVIVAVISQVSFSGGHHDQRSNLSNVPEISQNH